MCVFVHQQMYGFLVSELLTKAVISASPGLAPGVWDLSHPLGDPTPVSCSASRLEILHTF